jgi:cathepsin A (carboxypeptidase C)
MRSYATMVPQLLTLPRGALFYQGQYDMYDGPLEAEAWLDQLQWPGQRAFAAAERVTLSRPVASREGDARNAPYGWMKSAGGLVWVVLAHASHMVPADQPEAALDMIERWIGGALSA